MPVSHRNIPRTRALPAFAAALLTGMLLCGCNRQNVATQMHDEIRREDMSWGPVEFLVTAEPATVSLERDILLTIRIKTPSEIKVSLPPLRDRLAGFTLKGMFPGEPETSDGKTILVKHVRLTPVIAEEYRIAPIPVEYTDHSRSPPETGWFATRPMTFERRPVGRDIPNDIRTELEPVWIYPPFRTVALWVAAALGAAAVIVLLVWLARRVKRHVQVMRMSPRERALRELSALLSKDLPHQHRIKDFYVELTMIVRRYIERSHRIRAPEQTTEEFLQEVTRDPRFPPEVLRKLREFLQAADLVKFAAYRPDEEKIEGATSTARDYIEHDAAEAEAEPGEGGS